MCWGLLGAGVQGSSPSSPGSWLPWGSWSLGPCWGWREGMLSWRACFSSLPGNHLCGQWHSPATFYVFAQKGRKEKEVTGRASPGHSAQGPGRACSAGFPLPGAASSGAAHRVEPFLGLGQQWPQPLGPPVRELAISPPRPPPSLAPGLRIPSEASPTACHVSGFCQSALCPAILSLDRFFPCPQPHLE